MLVGGGADSRSEIRDGEHLMLLVGPDVKPRPTLRLRDRVGRPGCAPFLPRSAQRKPADRRQQSQKQSQNDRKQWDQTAPSLRRLLLVLHTLTRSARNTRGFTIRSYRLVHCCGAPGPWPTSVGR